MEVAIQKRVKVRQEFPVNIFFQHVLTKFWEDAKARDIRSHYNYSKALKSLAKYPLELKSAWDALNVIEGFGKDTCRRLEQCLENYRARHGTPRLETIRELEKDGHDAYFQNPSNDTTATTKFPKCNSSNSVCDEGSSCGVPVKRAKTFPQSSVKVTNTCSSSDAVDNIGACFSKETGNARGCATDSKCIELNAGCFEIVLVVDWAEREISALKKAGLNFERRRLSAGDFVWIARHIHYHEQELVLDYIVERKRLDDLAKSIYETRYRDQKVRLRECGIKNRIFLVEWMENAASNIKTLKQAMLNTQVHEDFYLKVTQNPFDTAMYLSSMTSELKRKFQTKNLKSATLETTDSRGIENSSVCLLRFGDFQTVSAKTVPLTAREVFAKQLMVCRGMTGEKANAIVSHYPTFPSILQAYQKCADASNRNGLLEDIVYGHENKRIGPALSRNIAQFFEFMF